MRGTGLAQVAKLQSVPSPPRVMRWSQTRSGMGVCVTLFHLPDHYIRDSSSLASSAFISTLSSGISLLKFPPPANFPPSLPHIPIKGLNEWLVPMSGIACHCPQTTMRGQDWNPGMCLRFGCPLGQQVAEAWLLSSLGEPRGVAICYGQQAPRMPGSLAFTGPSWLSRQTEGLCGVASISTLLQILEVQAVGGPQHPFLESEPWWFHFCVLMKT